VPANRIGSAVYSPAELKTMQEVITLIVFAGFTAVYFKEPLSLTQGAGFALIALGAVLVFRGQDTPQTAPGYPCDVGGRGYPCDVGGRADSECSLLFCRRMLAKSITCSP